MSVILSSPPPFMLAALATIIPKNPLRTKTNFGEGASATEGGALGWCQVPWIAELTPPAWIIYCKSPITGNRTKSLLGTFLGLFRAHLAKNRYQYKWPINLTATPRIWLGRLTRSPRARSADSPMTILISLFA